MMNKRMLILVIALALLSLPLCGCQLARADAGEAQAGDRLIGAFITTEYLDLFDFESYFSDNASKLIGGGEITLSGADDGYNGRIYATVKTVSLTNEDTGETVEHEEYVFDGLDGIPYFKVVTEGESKVYSTSNHDGAISDVAIAVNHSDGVEEEKIEGTVYIATGHAATYYLNPVYQASDGSVYLTSGSGIIATQNTTEGVYMSQSMYETFTVNENGEETTQKFSVVINFSLMFTPERYTITQMDASNKLIQSDEYALSEIPDSISVQKETEYLIIEKHSVSPEGEPIKVRYLSNSIDAYFQTFTVGEDGICIAKMVNILWS